MEALLFEHQRADVPCQRSITRPPEGLNKSQEKALRSRKQRTPEVTEEQKWKEIYRILFPQDIEDTMPSFCKFLRTLLYAVVKPNQG